jgi:hypothetical protein
MVYNFEKKKMVLVSACQEFEVPLKGSSMINIIQGIQSSFHHSRLSIIDLSTCSEYNFLEESFL